MIRRFLLAGALLTLSGAAMAQYTQNKLDVTPTNIAFRGGVFFPLDSSLRSVQHTFIDLAMEYTFPKQFIAGSSTYLAVDWFAKSGSGAHGNIFPITLNQRFYTGGGVGEKISRRNYWFVGIGAFVFDVTQSNTKIGVRGGVGVDIGPNTFVEATGYASDRSNGNVRANGISLNIGYRF